MKIAVSYLKSDNYKKTIEKINETSADLLHVDMCDGKYVSNKNFTISELVKLLKNSTKPLDIHMMVKDPLKYVDELAMLNVDAITIHIDSCNDPLSVIDYIQSIGLKAGIAINPDQDIKMLNPFLGKVDEVLVMSVVPGLGGQSFIESTVDKLNEIIALKDKYNFTIGVDGGINLETIDYVKNKHIDKVISGSYITMSDSYEDAIKKLSVKWLIFLWLNLDISGGGG